jgi:hypothetical protein
VAGQGWRLGVEMTSIDPESERVLVTFCHVVYPWRQLRPHDEIVAIQEAMTVFGPSRSRRDILEELRREVDAIECRRRSPRADTPERPTRERARRSDLAVRE